MNDANRDDRDDLPEGPKGPDASELVESVLGWNARFLGTIWASLIRPVDVARAALASDSTQYVSALRLFIFLYGALMALSALVGGSTISGVQAMTGASAESLSQWAQGSEYTLADIESSVSFWSSIVIWPITAVSSAFYILLFKAYAPKRTMYGHLLVYLITNNGSVGLQLVLIAALSVVVDFATVSLVSTAGLLVTYFVITARVISALYATTIAGTVVKLLGVVLILPVALIISGVLQFTFIALLVQLGFDLSIFDLMTLDAGATP